MKLIVNGAGGHMGREIVRLAKENYCGSCLAAAVDPMAAGNGIVARLEDAAPGDIIIDFSHHSCTASLLQYACGKNLPVVIATTGHTAEEKQLIAEAATQIPVFYSGNFSVGIATLCALAKQTAAMFPDADIEIVETHHNRKVDAPSGTALMLANAIQEVRTGAEIHCGRSGYGRREAGEIGIQSIRRGDIVGIHEVIVSTQTQTISLKHEAHNRALFAEGAITAAKFLLGKPAGLYDMQSMIRVV